MIIFAVNLYNDFECIADACPNTCCAGWCINIDEKTYQKMVEKEDLLGIPANDWITKNGDSYSAKLRSNGHCPMLNENNLCKVVLTLGDSYLSDTCTSYPRVHKQYGNILETFLHPSCPEVIAKLISNENVTFDFWEDSSISASPYAYNELYLYESAIRTSIIDLLYHSPDISLKTRLFTAYNIINEAVTQCQNSSPDFNLMKGYIDSFCQSDKLIALDSHLKDIVKESNRYRFLQELQNIILESVTLSSEHYTELVRQTVEYFYQNDFEKYLNDIVSFKTFVQSYNQFYTNYWVYRIFAELIAIPDYSQVKEKFFYIAIELCLIQTIGLVSFVHNGTLDINEYIYIISYVSRRLEHTSSFRQMLTNQLKKNNMISGAGILLLTIF